MLDLLFSYKGRIGRAQFWLVVLIFVVAALIYFAANFFVQSFYLSLAVALLICAPAFYSAVGAGIKRLHDRNKSSWWLLLFYLGPLVAFSGASLLDGGTVGGVLSALGFIVQIWTIAELGALRGSIGANPYGPDPVAPKPAQH